jgi:methionyl aminopeptidase
MIIQSQEELVIYQKAAQASTQILQELKKAVQIDKTPLEIDQLADQLCAQFKVRPNFKGQGNKNNPYQYATCISVNDAVVHGIPTEQEFVEGDLVKVDFGIEYRGLNTDHCFSVGLGKLTPQDEHLLAASRKAVLKGVKKAVVGNTTGDIGHAIEKTAQRASLTVIKEFIGHGIGQALHEDPELPAFGKAHSGQPLQKGMLLCVEAQITNGNGQVYTDSDGWTSKTTDGAKVAMFEYLVMVDDDHPLVLTPTMSWTLVNK